MEAFLAGKYLFPLVAVGAYALDLMLGDPLRLPHPVRWLGAFIGFMEGAMRRLAYTPLAERIAGVALAFLTVSIAYALIAGVLYLASLVSVYLYLAISIWTAWMCLSLRSLHAEGKAVIDALKRDGVKAARQRLGRIVGRDTEDLDPEGIIRASSETVAENASDGVVAPLFYLALGGPALMMAYKAVNTLDSMVGYKNRRYLHFGWASARLDDLANFVPARLTAVLMVVASFVLGYDWQAAARVALRDGANHPSPNSGFPEAAVAGALGVRFGGGATYGGVLSEKPFIGDAVQGLSPETTLHALNIMDVTAFLMLIAVLTARWFFAAP